MDRERSGYNFNKPSALNKTSVPSYESGQGSLAVL